jgi:hypothetical protein
MDTGLGKGLLEIAFALMSIALVGMLIARSDQTAQVVTSLSTNFADLIRTVTMQSPSGVGRGGYGGGGMGY